MKNNHYFIKKIVESMKVHDKNIFKKFNKPNKFYNIK